MSQYKSDAWGTEKGFPGGSISSFAQTPDGWLWIGTDKGLIRFDGVSFHKIDQASIPFPIAPVQQLLTGRYGNLWILLQTTKLVRYRDGTFDIVRGEAENGITALGPGAGRSVLVSSLAMGTMQYNGQTFERIPGSPATSANPGEPFISLAWSTGLKPHRLATPKSAAVTAMATDAAGKIWLGTEAGGLFYLSEGRVSEVPNTLLPARITCLLPVDAHQLWIGTEKGMLRWDGAELTRTRVPPALQHVEIFSMIRDRDANVWLGAARGLVRLKANGEMSLSEEGAFAGDPVTALFEDQQGDIWTGGPRSVARFEDNPFVTYSVPSLKSQGIGPLYAAPDDRTWFAPIEGGLRWLKDGKVESVTAGGLDRDIIYSIAGNGTDSLWIGRQQGGLTHLRYGQGSFAAETYREAEGLAQDSVFTVYESRDGTVWAGTLSGGLSRLRNGHFTNYTTGNGLPSDTISAIAEGSDGTMWFGTPKGLSAMSGDGWKNFAAADGLPSEEVNCLLPDAGGLLWIGTAAGVAVLRDGHLRAPRLPDTLHEPVFGMEDDHHGWLWLATANHILQVRRQSLLDDTLGEADFREYGPADGLRGTEGVKRQRSVVADSRGRIWFATNQGLSVINPLRGALHPYPPLVHIESVLMDGAPLNLRAPIRVSAAQQKITFRFVGVSLSDPERIRYRYQLEGLDKDWSDPVVTPEAGYSNLGPRPYKFRVMALNTAGLGQTSETAIGFEVTPTLWQSWWFRLALLSCACLVTLAIYRLRMAQLTRLLNVRFEERLAERTRIAQELHDTLLQGMLSASMQLHVAADQIAPGSPARATVDRVLHIMGQVIDEGRSTLRGLRSSAGPQHDLKSALSRIPFELGKQDAVDFRVVVEGAPLPIRWGVRDDVYRIGREALVNALQHSGARSIELELEYAPNELRMLVNDDGCGIDPEHLETGKDGHWGLPGMRERAERIGGKLKVFSRRGSGTVVDLSIPGAIAFEPAPPTLLSKWYRRFQPDRRSKPQS